MSSISFAGELGLPAYFNLYLKKDTELFQYGIPHPCGRQLAIRSFNIPLDEKIFVPDMIFEISNTDEILNTWPSPLDGSLIGFDGERVIYSLSEDGGLVSVSNNGQIQMALEIGPFEKVAGSCPDIDGSPNIAKHYYCLNIQDKNTGNVRRFAVEPACT